MSEVAELESQIRDFLIEERQEDLLRDKANWYKIVACLDAIGDTEQAFDAFLGTKRRNNFGEWYLAVYGVMQALILQQDAVAHFAEALKLQYKRDNTLTKIRELRNHSIGHPTRRGNPPGDSFSAIARISLSSRGFRMLTTDRRTATDEFRSVDVPSLIAKQRSLLGSTLRSFLNELTSLA